MSGRLCCIAMAHDKSDERNRHRKECLGGYQDFKSVQKELVVLEG